MLHRNAGQAGEDGPQHLRGRRADKCPPMELGADLKHKLHGSCDRRVPAALREDKGGVR